MKYVGKREFEIGGATVTLARVQKEPGNVLLYWYAVKVGKGWKIFDVRELGVNLPTIDKLSMETALPTAADLVRSVGLDAVLKVAFDD